MEQVTDKALLEEELALESSVYFAIEALPGQFDQCAASSQELSFYWVAAQNVRVHTGQLFILNGNVLEEELAAIKNYLLILLILVSKIWNRLCWNRNFLFQTALFQI